jgi:hypothetical protein
MPKYLAATIGEEVELPGGYRQKCGNFRMFPLNSYISVYINQQIKDTLKNFKTLSSSCPNCFLTHKTSFIQTQIGATVSVNI